MITLRRMKAIVTGAANGTETAQDSLEAAWVPVVGGDVDCRICPEPCDQGHDEYPARFDVDMESKMLGSVKPYCRQVVISTGKADWEREVTDAKGSLALYLSSVASSNHKGKVVHSTISNTNPAPAPAASSPSLPATDIPLTLRPKQVDGIFTSSDASRISILNGSHKTLCDNNDEETVLVFPDYKIVAKVARTQEDAAQFYNLCIDPHVTSVPSLSFVEKSPFNTWVIPYSVVILLCSHKRRDNRCHIAAGKLEIAFTHSLQQRGWHVDTQLEHPHDPPLEDLLGDETQQEAHIAEKLQEYSKAKHALIIKNSHTGGHRYAGNCIIYTPQGSGVWYGRVSTHEVQSIVEQTLEGGKVLPPLLRGGVNISRPGCKSLNEW